MKKKARVQILPDAKEKREAEKLAKLTEKEKEKEREKEEKANNKGKKKAEVTAQVLASFTIDQGSQLQVGSQSGIKRKATLSEFTKEVITHVSQGFLLTNEDVTKSEDLILNASI